MLQVFPWGLDSLLALYQSYPSVSPQQGVHFLHCLPSALLQNFVHQVLTLHAATQCPFPNVHFLWTPNNHSLPCLLQNPPCKKSICSLDVALINACPAHKARRPSLKWHSCTSCPLTTLAADFLCSTTLPFLPCCPSLFCRQTAPLQIAVVVGVVLQPLPLKLDYSAAQLSLLRSTQLYLYCIQYICGSPPIFGLFPIVCRGERCSLESTIGYLLLSLLTCLAAG